MDGTGGLCRFRVNFMYGAKVKEALLQKLDIVDICHFFNSKLSALLLEVESVKHQELEQGDVELTFDLRCHGPSWKSDNLLFRLMSVCLRRMAEFPFPLPTHHNPVITVPCRQVFKNELISRHKDIPLKAIYFGNLLNRGLLMVHWEISFYSDPRDECKNKEFTAEFIHDENIAQFSFWSKEWTSAQNGTLEFHRYILKFPYNTVKSVIVDNVSIDDTHGMRSRINRLHFVLNTPVQIYKNRQRPGQEMDWDGDRFQMIYRGRNFEEKPASDLVLTECPVFTVQFAEKQNDIVYSILTRIYHHNRMYIQFSKIQMCYALVPKVPAMDGSTLIYVNFVKMNVKIVQKVMKVNFDDCLVRMKYFSLFYLLEALISRGAVVKDQLLLYPRLYEEFLLTILSVYEQNESRCEWALEELLGAIDERKDVTSFRGEFMKFARAPKDAQEITQRETMIDGYVKCRKVVITPTRVLYIAPEMMMGNRVIRKYGTEIHEGDKILRVSFRDDDGQLMRRQQVGERILRKRVSEYMRDGLYVGGMKFSYLGNSNSQMRDHGCYFIMGNNKHARDIRRNLGKFDELPNIPKIVARLGQCFTQSRESNAILNRTDYDTVSDFIGGMDSQGSEYTYSDGVGRIAERFLVEISQSLKLGRGFVPACIQFRFRGGKGVLTKDPSLDQLISFANELDLVDKKSGKVIDFIYFDPLRVRLHKVQFRDSQMKFSAPLSNEMEVVKYSTPTPVSLNRPWINILDQVSEMQSLDIHNRMCNRIEELLDRHVRNSSIVLIDENCCRNKLKELPHRIDIDMLATTIGFNLSVEPFFRSLVKAAVRYTLLKQLQKQQIQIPFDQGRSMFGVVDETGLLQYGQIFVRYTMNMDRKNLGRSGSSKILTGRVLVTKNPCIVAGDVRLFEAIDLPELHHLVDVIVFPRHGPRPHPDEMAGSDLDGDEYSVVWDPQLMFNYNEKPMDYAKSVTNLKPVNKDDLVSQMIEYYQDYMLLDNVGSVALAFLTNSDLNGIDSRVALQIAQKHSEAVDFPKTGKPPDKLTVGYSQFKLPNGQVEEVPPERAARHPDFMEKDYEPAYMSMRMIGKIYREVKSIQDILKYSEESDSQRTFDMDPRIDIEGWREYEEEAKEEYANYVAALRREMDHYGVHTEAEILTGCIIDMRNRISDKDGDDMSFFNTTHTIETKINIIWTVFRKEFFEKTDKKGRRLGNYNDETEFYEKQFVDYENPLHRYVRTANEEMKKKAVAYYKVCYEIASDSSADSGRFMSFPWIVWDVLKCVKQSNISYDEHTLDDMEKLTFYSRMATRMSDYCRENEHSLEGFVEGINDLRAINAYCRVYDGRGKWGRQEEKEESDDGEMKEKREEEKEEDELGLSEILFFICEWARVVGVLNSRMRVTHICLIFLQYATGTLDGVKGQAITPLPLQDNSDVVIAQDIVQSAGRRRVGQVGQMITYFFQYIGSRIFRRVPSLCFEEFGVESMFFDDEWVQLHEAARTTYFSMVFSNRFEDLKTEEDEERQILPVVIREGAPFTIDLPPGEDEEEIRRKLIEKCGLTGLSLRRKKGHRERANRVRVSAMGTNQSLKKLRNLLMIKPLRKTNLSGLELEKVYAQMTLRRIKGVDRGIEGEEDIE